MKSLLGMIGALGAFSASFLIQTPSLADLSNGKLYTVQINEPIVGQVIESPIGESCILSPGVDLVVAEINENKHIVLLEYQRVNRTCAGITTVPNATEQICHAGSGLSPDQKMDNEHMPEFYDCMSAYSLTSSLV